jgi:predicted RNA methylase
MLALQIAAQCSPKMVIGIDIDSRLVKNAIENMHRVINHDMA